MQLLIKVSLSVLVILAATGIARRFPSLAGILSASFTVWLTAACVHQWILSR